MRFKGTRKDGAQRSPGSGFLARLRHDERGNAISIITAAIIPLVGMVGSGVDLSRAYMAKTRLQQACDAGVLAGRKVMVADVDDKVKAEVKKFVDFNFPQGTLQTTAFAINPTEGAQDSVDLTLATKVPTSLMIVFGYEDFDIEVSCTARQDFVNTDVMLVLDTTLSMNCAASSPANTYCPTESSSSKIRSVRAAVLELYRALKPAQDKLEAANLRLRYGIVPYGLTVNVGKTLYAKNPSWIRNPATYQKCDQKGRTGFTSVCNKVSQVSVTRNATWYNSTNWTGCVEERKTVNNITATSGYTAPSGALDHDLFTAPTSDADTKWAPYDPSSATARAGSPKVDQACPKPVRPLARFGSEADVTDWLASSKGFIAQGYTYHDTGLIWAGRLMSPNGMWASDNPNVFNGFPVNRHIIFLTDGLHTEVSRYTYNAYGVENYDQRTTSGGATESKIAATHLQRRHMLCNQLKGGGGAGVSATVWVIAFGNATGGGLVPELTSCASSPNHASHSSDQAALIARFKQIGQDIGALRLSR